VIAGQNKEKRYGGEEHANIVQERRYQTGL
jgi:hypothetical protein